MSSSRMSSSLANTQSPGLKTYFKTPEGRYKLHYEKTYPAGLLHYAHGKSTSQVTLAHLKDKTTSFTPPPSNLSASNGAKSVAARLLGGGNGSRTLGFGGNGVIKAVAGNTRTRSVGISGFSNSSSPPNYDDKGVYLIFNVGDTLFISDFNSQDKHPIKSIHFSNSNPVCHAFSPEANDGHDLLIGSNTGDVYSVSLRQQLQDPGKKLVGVQHYNKDGLLNNRQACPSQIQFDAPASHGFLKVKALLSLLMPMETYMCMKETRMALAILHSLSSMTNLSFLLHMHGPTRATQLPDGTFAKIDQVPYAGYLRIFNYSKELLVCGVKSYYGALLCCAWSSDGKYVLTGGEDDLVQVWSMEDRKVVAWGEGHNSWVSGVAFDSYWSSPASDGSGENIVYRFGSVGQDTRLLLWDLVVDEIVVPPHRHPPGGSPASFGGNQSSNWDNICSVGTLQPAPSMRDVPKLSPVVAHRVHAEPLSGLIFSNESVIAICREGHMKIWVRPGFAENQPSGLEGVLGTSKVGSSTYRP
ncbi:probable catabolite repression protein creC isoform X3 [Magnolia sinica]|uniref:probable catabolite repression protein creC isoform X3 n=1 Tax=Magnolia sinica TaxID=86752 RepID=UPI002658DC8E|nr:probable catabolite repression protein creC isoform X3 [Magnolia sinica]